MRLQKIITWWKRYKGNRLPDQMGLRRNIAIDAYKAGINSVLNVIKSERNRLQGKTLYHPEFYLDEFIEALERRMKEIV